MRLGPLYHWSPVERRKAIRVEGLRPYSEPTVSTGPERYPSISLSPTPSMAWGLSGDMGWATEIEDWDLWQVNLPDGAETHIRPFWGDKIEEIKVHTPIPANHLWHVGTRTVPFAEDPDPPE